MTKEDIKEFMPLMQAMLEGKTIQRHFDDRVCEWIDVEEIFIGHGVSSYRIKPESKYRPFKDVEECWVEMQKHSDVGWLKSKKTGSFGLIGSLYTQDEVLMIILATNECNKYTSFDVFNDYVFTDGTPFGIKEE